MRKNTDKTKEQKKKFDLTVTERAMLNEVKVILELFEFVTDEFQTNGISISRVYPAIKMLQAKLGENLDDYVYTKYVRKELLTSLNTRFSSLVENDVFLISTFLDPFFGPSVFDETKR